MDTTTAFGSRVRGQSRFEQLCLEDVGVEGSREQEALGPGRIAPIHCWNSAFVTCWLAATQNASNHPHVPLPGTCEDIEGHTDSSRPEPRAAGGPIGYFVQPGLRDQPSRMASATRRASRRHPRNGA
jgi:hypothetical protein